MAPPVPYLVDGILLRLRTPAALLRASTACLSFRRIITGRPFLRRYRKRHPPPLLGFVDRHGFHPAQPPHPSAPLASALAAAADFTYSFVPSPNDERWRPVDARDGRVLLQEHRLGLKYFRMNLAVCDPLSRRSVLLPPIHKDLLVLEAEFPIEIVRVLAPVGEEGEDETSFRVFVFACYKTKLVAFVFSSVAPQWCIAASRSWTSLGTESPHFMAALGCRGLSCLDYVRGCFYSTWPWMDKLLMINTQTMEFSTVNDRTGYHMKLRSLPGQADEVLARNDMLCRRRPGQPRSLPAIVVGREGTLEMFSLVGDHSPEGSFHLYHTTQLKNDQSSMEWQLENIIPLPGQYDYFTLGAAGGFLFLGATTEDQLYIAIDSPVWLSRTGWDVDYFSLEVQTSKITKICRRKRQFFHYEDVYWYFGLPPSLSKPSI